MRLLYQSLSYVPSRRASAVHVMKMCAAFARAGHDVTLTTKATPSRLEPDVEDDFAYYGVEENFAIRKLPRPLWKGGGLVHLWHTRRLPMAEVAPDLIYSRDLAAAVVTSRLAIPLVYEAHGPPAGSWSRSLYRRLFASPNLVRMVVISEALAQLFVQSGLLPRELEMVVAHDAADPLPETALDRAQLPPSLSSSEGTHVGYVGHLYSGRGIELIIQLAERMPDHRFHVVGGRNSDLDRWRSEPVSANLEFHGYVPPAQLGNFYKAFDIVLAPYQRRVMVAGGKTDTSAWMSPLKLFEYMASGKPIVSSDLPILREVLRHQENALLVPPDDVEAWQEAVEFLTRDSGSAQRLASAALSDFLRQHTWSARAERILAGI